MKNKEKSNNPIADHVEEEIKENSIKAEKNVRNGLDILENLLLKMLEIRPRERKLSRPNKKDSLEYIKGWYKKNK